MEVVNVSQYINFQFVYKRPEHGEIPCCEVYECESKENGHCFCHIIKKYFINKKEQIPFIEKELNTLNSLQHNNVLELHSYFPVGSNEFWFVFNGTNYEFSRYGTLNIEKATPNSTKAFLFDIVNALQYVVHGKLLLKPRINPKQFFGFHSPDSPFPVLKYLYEEQFDENENEANFPYCAPECYSGKTSEVSYLWSLGIIFTRFWMGYKEASTPEEYQRSIEIIRNGNNLEKLVRNEKERWILNLLLTFDEKERKKADGIISSGFFLDKNFEDRIRRGNVNDYQMTEEIGKGSFGKVYLCVKKSTKEKVAIKCGDQWVARENKVLMLCEHENIMKVYDYFTEDNAFGFEGSHHFLVMEYCDQGNLEEIIREREISEEEFYCWTNDLLNGLYYLHRVKRIVHRDLKTVNLLLKSNTKNVIPLLKISDYGLSREIDQLMTSFVGSTQYKSPQILLGFAYSEKTDLFSVGVILFHMLTRNYPFGKEVYEIKDNIQERNEIEFDDGVDENIKSFILGLLEIEEEKRFNWDDIFNHSFYKELMAKRFNRNSSLFESLTSSFDMGSF